MAKKTAVDWLQEIAKQREPDIFDWEKAKLMEKDQIKNSWVDGFKNWDIILNHERLEQYYNETFKQH